jgi:aminoglycoside phosphotransferase (APT) family kinase protein
MNDQERIALEIFNEYCLDFKTAVRAGGWTNAVWLNGDIALRLSFKKDSDRIRREVKLSEYSPDAIGYPVNIAVGITDGYEWSLSKRIYGKNLSEIWDNLNWKKRTEAIRQILRKIELLHKVGTSNIENLSNKNAWYSSFNAQETYSCLERYKREKIFSAEQIDVFYNILEGFWEKHNSAEHVLNHGDITMDNLLWSNGSIVSLMDFEHSVIAPTELDLHSLVNLAFFSDESSILSDSSIEEHRQYKNDVIALLKPMLENDYSTNLILGYAILFRMRFLEFWFENPEEKLEKLDAYNKLLSLANGKGGYLSEIIYL